MTCPKCDSDLPGLGTYCWSCGDYVDRLGSTNDAPAPACPADAIPDTRSEEQIQLAIRRALEALGFTVYDLSQGRPTRQTPGLADLYVVGQGRCAWVEVKRPGGRQSAGQRSFEEDVLANGGEYHVMCHESEAIAWAESVGRAA